MRELTADYVTVETPEHVVLTYELAGGVSRMVAGLIDAFFQALIFVVIAIVVAVAGGLSTFVPGQDVPLMLIGIATVAVFVDVLGYGLLFELFMRGQTPGKRFLGLRVISEGGYALTPSAVVVRNLMRIADFMPFGYVVGMLVMALNPHNKRTGDFVARTLVIRDVTAVAPHALRVPTLRKVDGDAVDALRRAGVHRLTEEHVHVVESFLERRHALDMAQRKRLGRALADRIAGVIGVEPGAAEVFLMDVLAARKSVPAK